MKLSFSKLLAYAILPISILSINQWLIIYIGNTVFWWIIEFIIILLFLKVKKTIKFEKGLLLTIILFEVWVLINFIRGFFYIENYWDTKRLISNTLVLLLPLAVFVSTPKKIAYTLRVWFKYALIIFIILLSIMIPEAYGKFLIPVSFLFLFFPKLPVKFKILSIACLLIVIAGGLDARSNIIKFITPLIFGLFYYFRKSPFIFKFTHSALLIAPFILLVLGLTGVFNVFKMDEYIGSDFQVNKNDGSGTTELTVDTRTFIYIEEITSAIKHNYVLLGRTQARGYESLKFGSGDDVIEKETGGRGERHGSEVSILNIFNWLGLVGVVLYFLIFFRASYLAIYVSNNVFSKIIGLNITFRWLYAWIEDFSQFDLSNLFLWFMIGMSFSPIFRNMRNIEFIYWVRNGFITKIKK